MLVADNHRARGVIDRSRRIASAHHPAGPRRDAGPSDQFDCRNITEHLAGGIDDSCSTERDPRPEEGFATAGVGDEAHVLTVGLGSGAQTQRCSPRTHLRLGEVPNGKDRAAQFALRQHVHDVALVLRRIGAAMNIQPITDRLDPGMVTRGNRIEAEEIGALTEPLELQMAIALDARIRGESLAMRAHVRIDDVSVEVIARS